MFKNLTLKTSVIQAFCFAASGAVSGFAMVTLLSKGLTSTQVGILLAVSGAMAAVIQPLLGAWADKSEKVSPRLLLIAIVSSIIVLLLAFIFLPSNLLLMSLIYGIASALLLSLQPLINSLVFEYIDSGHPVNFGIGRGVGSLAYALSSFALGALLNIYKPSIIPYVAVITLIFLLLSILAMPVPPKKTRLENKPEEAQEIQNSDAFGFIKKYQHFLFFLLGIVFIFIFQSLSNGYLLQILRHVGGNDSDLGTTL
ncbi:MAG: MFS transporter, partial [Streptococcaceae bacterium]|nr:MFS transporter [Streptococcaceae bacterium]